MMPKVRILQSISGLDFSWVPGETVDMTDDDAQVWADGERAELVEDDRRAAAKEAPAAQPPTEKAAQRSRGGGRSRKTETRDDTADGDTAGAENAADGSNDPAQGGSTPDSGD